MSSKVFRHILLTGLFAALSFQLTSGKNPDVSVKVELDSAVLMMGRTTPLHVEILQPKGTQGMLLIPADTLMTNVEIAHAGVDDTTKSGAADQLEQIKRMIILQSFDSGLYRLPPLAYMTEGGDTVYSNTLLSKYFLLMLIH